MLNLDLQTWAMIKDIALGQFRHWATIAGTVLASHGVLAADAGTQGKFVEVSVGVAVAGVSLLSSWWEKTGKAKAEARVVEILAQQEVKKQAAAKAYADAQAAQQAIKAALPAAVLPAVPQQPTA